MRLVKLGAVDALIGCLDSHNESVVWAAVHSLKQLRSAKALPALVGLLERDVLPAEVTSALRAITGEDFGTDAARWRESIAAVRSAEGQAPSTAEVVQQTAAQLRAELSGREPAWELLVPLSGGRRQRVVVRLIAAQGTQPALTLIYSECGPADPRLHEAVLRKNLTIPAGAFALREVEGRLLLALADTLPTQMLNPGLLAWAIENIGSRADLVERGLVEQDLY